MRAFIHVTQTLVYSLVDSDDPRQASLKDTFCILLSLSLYFV